MAKIEMTLFYTDDFGNRHGPFVKYEEPKIKTRDTQQGWADAMSLNGSLRLPVGIGRTIIECELARKFERPLFVSSVREMIEQFEQTSSEMGVKANTCHIRNFRNVYDALKPDCVIACESILRYGKYTQEVLNCGTRVWMNRSS